MNCRKRINQLKARDHILKKILLVLMALAAMLPATLCYAGFNKAGRTSMQFLKIGIGARSVAMGQACIADMSDVNAAFWNAAAITEMEGRQVSFSYNRWIADLNVVSGALGFQIPQVGAFALTYTSLDYGNIQEALTTSPAGGVDTRTGDTFSGSDLAIGLGFSRQYTDKLSIGVQIKYLREELFTFSSSLWGFDVGSLYHTGWRGIRLAMSAQNFARQARWMHTTSERQQSFELPLLFRIGWSIDLYGGEDLFLGGNAARGKWTLNMDALHSNDYAERLHIGTEYTLLDLISFRAGYRFNYEEGNLSLGTGLNYTFGRSHIIVDYAYVNYEFLESPHRLTMTLVF